MSTTAFATGDNLTAKLWSADVIKEALKQMFFGKYTGSGDGSIIQVRNDLTKKKGDQITIPLRMRATSDGVSGSTSIEDNEEAMSWYDYSIVIDMYGNGVRAADKMSLQRPAFDLRSQFRDWLSDWWAEFADRKTLERLSTSPTTNRRAFGGTTATTDATLGAADTLSVATISQAKRKAQLATPKVRPIRIGGQEYYIMLVHPYQYKALKADTTYFLPAMRDADVRGKGNAIFTGANFYWDGVFVVEYERIQTQLAGGSFESGDACAVGTARALLLGAQAGIHAYGQYAQWYEKLFDFDRIPGAAIDVLWEAGKTVFNSEDYGCITVDTAITVD